MLQSFAQIVFYALTTLFAVYSFLLIYVLLRFGQSRILGFTLSALYVFALLVLYSTAQYYFSALTFPPL